jgi:hypothetical protein
VPALDSASSLVHEDASCRPSVSRARSAAPEVPAESLARLQRKSGPAGGTNGPASGFLRSPTAWTGTRQVESSRCQKRREAPEVRVGAAISPLQRGAGRLPIKLRMRSFGASPVLPCGEETHKARTRRRRGKESACAQHWRHPGESRGPVLFFCASPRWLHATGFRLAPE